MLILSVGIEDDNVLELSLLIRCQRVDVSKEIIATEPGE